MKKTVLIFTFVLLCISLSAIVIPAGNVSGNWSAEDNPYYIDGDITIPVAEELIIEPGVEILFNDTYSLMVEGRIVAEGTETDSISFSCIDEALGWYGIRFINTDCNGLPPSSLMYCHLEKGAAIGTDDYANGGAVFCTGSSNLTIDHCFFTLNYAALDGGAIYLENASDIQITNSYFTQNDCGFFGACLISYTSSPVISYCDFIENHSAVFAAGISAWELSDVEIYNCRFIDNYAGACAGIYGVSSDMVIVNSLFIGNENQFGSGAAVALTSCNTTASNLTIVDNTAALAGGAFWVNNGQLDLYNSILWGNIPEQIGLLGTGVAEVYDCCIQNGYDGTNVISDSPLFEDYATYDLHLTEDSPCIDLGNAELPEMTIPETDLDGMDRIMDGNGDGELAIDLGAYEFELVVIYEPPAHLNIDPATAFISWEAPSSPELTGYNIYLNGEMIAEITETEYQFTDLIDGEEYTVAVSAQYPNGESDLVEVVFVYSPVDTNQNEISPVMSLGNYPNPFNPRTMISFQLTETSIIDLNIFNSRGQLVKNLHSGNLNADSYSFAWNGLDDNGMAVGSGIYFYKLNANSQSFIGKMILMK